MGAVSLAKLRSVSCMAIFTWSLVFAVNVSCMVSYLRMVNVCLSREYGEALASHE